MRRRKRPVKFPPLIPLIVNLLVLIVNLFRRRRPK